MQILGTIFHDTIWGGSRLLPYAPRSIERIGHLYGCIDQDKMCSTVLGGSFAGKNIHDWFIDNQIKYGLERFNRFPLVLALVDAKEDLSIQVHPDQSSARKLAGAMARGKNESFYVLEPPKTRRMINGSKVDDKKIFIELIRQGKWSEAVDTMELAKGDYVYVEAGTVHAMTAGSLCFEVEENSELTYRLYDFERTDSKGVKRYLQQDEAAESLHLSQKSSRKRFVKDKPIIEKNYSCQLFIDSIHLTNKTGEFSLLTLLEGTFQVGEHLLYPGNTIILEEQDSIKASKSSWMLTKVIH